MAEQTKCAISKIESHLNATIPIESGERMRFRSFFSHSLQLQINHTLSILLEIKTVQTRLNYLVRLSIGKRFGECGDEMSHKMTIHYYIKWQYARVLAECLTNNTNYLESMEFRLANTQMCFDYSSKSSSRWTNFAFVRLAQKPIGCNQARP